MGGSWNFTLPERVVLLPLPDGRAFIDKVSAVDLMDAHVVERGLLGAVELKGNTLIPVPGVAVEAPGTQTAYEVVLRESDWKLKANGMLQIKLPSPLKIAHSLCDQGVLREHRYRKFGILPRVEFPAVDPQPRRDEMGRLRQVLLGEIEPQGDDPATLLVMRDS